MSSTEWGIADFKEWLSRPGNGDALCTCGHQINVHLADLTACGDYGCLDCKGFNLDHSGSEAVTARTVPVRFVRTEDGSFNLSVEGSTKSSRMTSTTSCHKCGIRFESNDLVVTYLRDNPEDAIWEHQNGCPTAVNS